VSPAVTRPQSQSNPECPVGAGCVSAGAIILIVILIVAAACLLLYALWAIWPVGAGAAGTGAHATTGGNAQTSGTVSISVFGKAFSATKDEQLFAIVALAGALGGLLHTLRSLKWYIGNRHLKWSWVAFYVLTPLVGAAAATIFYVVARAGLFSPSADTSQVSPFGFAAISSLVGLFAEEAMLKLKSIAKSVFTETEPGLDHVPPSSHAPPGARMGAVSNLAPTTVDVSGTVEPAGVKTRWSFEYGPTGYTVESTGGELSGSGAQGVTETLRGLSPQTDYKLRLKATNPNGTTYGAETTFQTK
jgi:hypothetical protein